MKKLIELSIAVNNPTDQAISEILKAFDDAVETIEYLKPSAKITIEYLE